VLLLVETDLRTMRSYNRRQEIICRCLQHDLLSDRIESLLLDRHLPASPRFAAYRLGIDDRLHDVLPRLRRNRWISSRQINPGHLQVQGRVSKGFVFAATSFVATCLSVVFRLTRVFFSESRQ